MARLPGYIDATVQHTSPNTLAVEMRLRPWHPSILPLIWSIMAVEPRILKPLMVLWAWVHLIRTSEREVAA